MKSADVLVNVLGSPPRPDGSREFAQQLGVALPDDYVDFASSYGDALLDEFIFFAGSKTLMRLANGIGRDLEASDSIPGDVLPTKGGMLLWGHTIDGDQLFLKQQAEGQWTVSAWLRQRASWYETELGIIEWLKMAFDNEQSPDWLPVWPESHEWELV